MKIVSTGLARSIWLFPISDLNPKGLSPEGFIAKVISRYGFKKASNTDKDYPPNALHAFSGGAFSNSKGDRIGVGLTVYSDGLIADTHSTTEDGEEFLSEALQWIHETFGLIRPSELAIRKRYMSNVFLSEDAQLQNLNSKLATFIKLLSSMTMPLSGSEFQLSGLRFTSDSTANRGTEAFIFERAANAPFSENRYYSSAPVPSKLHVELLENLIRIFG